MNGRRQMARLLGVIGREAGLQERRDGYEMLSGALHLFRRRLSARFQRIAAEKGRE